MKDGFIFHFENAEDLEDMTLEEKGMIFDAMIAYSIDGTEPEFNDRALKTVWKPIRRRLDKDSEAYEERCRRNSENGKKGGRPSKVEDEVEKANGFFENPEKPKKSEWFLEKPKKANTDTETDTDTDTKTKTDTDTETDTESNKVTQVKEKQSKKKAAASAYVSDPRVNDAICQFIEHRKKIRKPMTDYAVERLVKRLQGMVDDPDTQISILNKAIDKGWQDIYPPDDVKNKPKSKGNVDAHILSIINGETTIGGGEISDTG